MVEFVILAPHIDDETIGCFTLLKKGLVKSVYWFFDLEDYRIKEGDRVADHFGFRPEYRLGFNALNGVLLNDIMSDVKKDTVVLVPTSEEWHPHHKAIFGLGKMLESYGLKVGYYSVYMNVEWVKMLPKPMQNEKKNALYKLFPSQREVFDSYGILYVFEGIVLPKEVVLDGT